MNPSSRRSKAAAASDSGGSRSLTKGLQILETLAVQSEPAGLSAIAGIVGLGKASTLRLLRSLQESGYVSRDRNDKYRLDRDWPSKDQQARLREVDAAAEPLLRQLNADTGETVAMAFLFGDLIRVTRVFESTQQIKMSNYPGRVLQPYASSLGKSITAFQPVENSKRLLHTYGIFSLTPHTLTDFQAIQHDLAQVRKRGYAWDREETVLEGVCIGAPVVAGGAVYAAISTSMPKQRFSAQVEKHLPGLITGVAARISKSITAPKRSAKLRH